MGSGEGASGDGASNFGVQREGVEEQAERKFEQRKGGYTNDYQELQKEVVWIYDLFCHAAYYGSLLWYLQGVKSMPKLGVVTFVTKCPDSNAA